MMNKLLCISFLLCVGIVGVMQADEENGQPFMSHREFKKKLRGVLPCIQEMMSVIDLKQDELIKSEERGFKTRKQFFLFLSSALSECKTCNELNAEQKFFMFAAMPLILLLEDTRPKDVEEGDPLFILRVLAEKKESDFYKKYKELIPK